VKVNHKIQKVFIMNTEKIRELFFGKDGESGLLSGNTLRVESRCMQVGPGGSCIVMIAPDGSSSAL